ncbi:MAG: polyprenyl synthetase family protein [Thermoplasmata archaeon]|jgi:octaprenyl-diphosphate synthase|nr:polyprenyl synthetase family protein [Thermoplasmata archaeon]
MTTAPWDFGVNKELKMVDEKLREMVSSEERTLTDASLHVIEAGGKRMRPTITLLSYKCLGGEDAQRIVDVAAAFELIHSATLIHDDINDGGLARRGRETVYKKYGLHSAIVTGDFLFVKAFSLGGMFDKMVVQTTADACARLAEGEVLQNRYRHTNEMTVDTYIKVMERKTAEPIRAGAMIGAYLAKGSSEAVSELGAYGMNLGIAFQIVDDILDFTGDESRTGKPTGMDLKEGYLTLPSLLAMKTSEDARREILRIVKEEKPSAGELRDCVSMVVDAGAVEKARGMAEYYALEALQHIGSLPDNVYSKSLRDLVGKVLNRDS